MAKATKTIKQALRHKPQHAFWFAATQLLFNQVAAFYFSVAQAHPGVLDLSSQEALTALERLTHTTAGNPHPVMPLTDAVAAPVPAMFRRPAIHAALGSARSFSTHLDKWRKRKEKALAQGKKFTEHPPLPPRSWNRSVILYAGQWRERTKNTILLKLWTGSSWAWIKCRISGRSLPDEWGPGSAQLVRHGAQWWLHTPLEQALPRPGKVKQQLTTNPEIHLCSIDLNIEKQLAVCSIQTVEGTVIATRFIEGGKELHGFRKRQLGRIARNRKQTGIIAEGEQDNARLWAKIRALDEDAAHRVSCRIVDFAKEHHAQVLVFEHLRHFKPQKGTYSRRGNEKRTYWLRGKIFKYSRYKAWNEGIVTCRVSPRNTSRDCARCGAPVARYRAGEPAEGYMPGAPLVSCAQCNMKGNADRNATIVIGRRLLARYHLLPQQEKPRTRSLHKSRSSKEEGGVSSQEARRTDQPSTGRARHGRSVEHGTAHAKAGRMGSAEHGIPR
jgi:putative transposase